MQPPSRILIVRFSSLGDIVLTSPVTRALRQRYPEAEIAITVKSEYEALAQLLPGVDTVIPFVAASGFHPLAARIRRQRFDLMIDLHVNPRSLLLSRVSGISHVIRYHKRRMARMGMVYTSLRSIPTRHTVDAYLDALVSLGIETCDRLPALVIHAAARNAAIERLRSHGIQNGRRILGLAPGASSSTKQWPIRHFARLGDQCHRSTDAAVLLIGGKRDKDTTAAVAAAMTAPSVDWAGSIDLSLLPAVLTQCRVLVSNDSGPMHIASAVATPVVGIFGPTHPRLGFTPLGAQDTVLSLDLECSPCSLHGEKPCWKGTHACLEDLPVNRVVDETVQRLL
jgi:heptosyltransferase-2